MDSFGLVRCPDDITDMVKTDNVVFVEVIDFY